MTTPPYPENPEQPAYPQDLEQPGLVRTGRSTFVRPIRPEDADRLVAFVGGLSRATLAYRSLGPVIRARDDVIRRGAYVDYLNELALVALAGDEIAGLVRYVRDTEDPEHAEVTFTIRDDDQSEGFGRLLLEHIAAAARARGIRVLKADVLADNTRMINVFLGSGYRVESGPPGQIVHFDIAVDPQAQAVARAERREHTAVRRSLRPLLEPRSVAVIGANRRPLTIGHELVANLLRGGFRGSVFPVNPQAEQVAGARAYPSVRELPEPPDLALIAVRAEAVPEVVRECAAAGVKAVVVVSTGFGETGAAGRTTELELSRFARASGMRLVGPNCMGVVNTTPAARLAATFSPALPTPGRVAMSSQSGPLGLAVLDLARRLRLGFSGFVSVGHAVDVSTNDLLQWWEEDPETSVILLHVETFGNPRRFARIARQVAPRKPIIAVHPGHAGHAQTTGQVDSGRRGGSGGRGDSTGAGHADPPGPSDSAVSSLFAQSGVIRTRSLQELFDAALLLAHQPPPPGNRVAVITNAGGPAALTVGACAASGLRVPPLGERTREKLRSALGPGAEAANPADLTPMATAAHYRQALDAVLADDGIDAAIVLFMPPLADKPDEVAAAILDAAEAAPAKPVVASFLGGAGVADLLHRGELVVPTYAFPESAAASLGHAAAYQAWRSTPAGVVPDLPGVDTDRARSLLAGCAPGPVSPRLAAELLNSYGIAVRDTGPGSGPGSLPSSGLGSGPGSGLDAFLSVGADPVFGPVVAFGLTGDYADLMADVAHRVTPLSDRDAREMVRSLRAAPLLDGRVGGPGVDLAALEETVLRISAMVEDLPEIEAMELRPIRLLPPGDGVAVTRATIRLADETRKGGLS
ncbi:acyl-CoA synthetase (NDP forming)/GNAT superfamily N-acetyltransferase [Streptomyces umbrinus]|uniref:bifunctional acetate--CoA ligase family protein/GNAT family N-acetyltransferase n=1 Tax=Streptomyces umbrinus TaxID=67370 RepID=UPI00167D16A8|nr:GNAT family N-acetyltransferase [Streptomyces umbrinus]MCR3724598.1 acyl-CoA synthetase (NDP forming)/GNAT superfamily N-acetyltransferase [Streptomyces umbrinus]GHH50892.1 GNAT family N-acetyltransferase [Streptomyces umbrinus]